MDALNVATLPAGALVLVDSAPIIYTLEAHLKFAARYIPLFQRSEDGDIALAITTISIAEILTGPLARGEDNLAKQYRRVFEAWHVVELSTAIAEQAAGLRARFRLKLPDAIQAASALAIGADALVTHDRDFSKLSKMKGLRILS